VEDPDGRLELEIAPGSEIDPEVLLDEIDLLRDAGHTKPLRVSSEATIITQEHKDLESGLVRSIGSTGKGIGAARAERLMRRAPRLIDEPDLVGRLEARGVRVTDAPRFSDSVVIEGTQGYALGLHAGHYPKCTSGNCRAIDFMSQAGVNPWDYQENTVWVVGRPFPIRVAGDSGHMVDETSWEDLGLPPEQTTVTKKTRRVGRPDWELLREAIWANGRRNVKVAMAMVDHVFPEVAGIKYGGHPEWVQAERWIRRIEQTLGAPIELVMSGPETAGWRDQ
jgi:adenylosuccinate synthase